jgi:hypothetical protein
MSATALVAALAEISDVVHPERRISVARDADDNRVLEAAVAAVLLIPLPDLDDGLASVAQMCEIAIGHRGTASTRAEEDTRSLGSSGSSSVWTGTPSKASTSAWKPAWARIGARPEDLNRTASWRGLAKAR